MSQFTIKFSFTVFVSAPSQKTKQLSRERARGEFRWLQQVLETQCNMPACKPLSPALSGPWIFWPRQDRCQGLADGTVVLHYYLPEQYLQAHFTQVHHTFWRHKQEPSRLLGGMGLTSQGGLISEWSPCYSKKNKARRQPPSTLQTLCPTPGHS